jgi:hypothetical protein
MLRQSTIRINAQEENLRPVASDFFLKERKKIVVETLAYLSMP